MTTPASSDPPPLPANPFSAPTAGPTTPTRTSLLAIASLVCGILSCPLPIIASIPGIVCGIMGLNRIGHSGRTPGDPRLTGQGLAIAGIIVSSLSILLVPVLVGLTLPAVQAAREAARRSACSNNLRQAAVGMLAHEAATGILPAAITAADGRPLLSWRVAILPHLGEQELYGKFRLDEPWDSVHNRALIAVMPLVYACPSATLDAGQTRYLLPDGPDAAFEPSRLSAGRGPAAHIRGVTMADLPGRPDNTLLIVEAPPDRAVAWTQPEEPHAAAAEAADHDGVRGGHALGIRMGAFADGHVEMIVPR